MHCRILSLTPPYPDVDESRSSGRPDPSKGDRRSRLPGEKHGKMQLGILIGHATPVTAAPFWFILILLHDGDVSRDYYVEDDVVRSGD